MKFYTSIERYGNTILYRGYDGAERIKKTHTLCRRTE